eukprot:scaffold22607_cov123-Cylindrotheca_fusiformis.AAC.13
MPKTKFYAVAIGKKVGVYNTWAECQAQVNGYPGNKFKSFKDRQHALAFVEPYLDKAPPTTSTSSPTVDQKKKKKKEVLTLKRPSPSSASSLPAQDPSSTNTTEQEPVRKRSKKITASMNPKDSSLRFQVSFDGGSRGNPGIAGAGAQVICTLTGKSDQNNNAHTSRIKTDIRYYLGDNYTNNQAEYRGLLCGLEHILTTLRQDYSGEECPTMVEIAVQGDSNLIIQQLKGNYDCKSPKLRSLYERAKQLIQEIQSHTSQQRLKLPPFSIDQQSHPWDGKRNWIITYDDEDGNLLP